MGYPISIMRLLRSAGRGAVLGGKTLVITRLGVLAFGGSTAGALVDDVVGVDGILVILLCWTVSE